MCGECVTVFCFCWSAQASVCALTDVLHQFWVLRDRGINQNNIQLSGSHADKSNAPCFSVYRCIVLSMMGEALAEHACLIFNVTSPNCLNGARYVQWKQTVL